LTKRVLETALDAEMTEHLGRDKHSLPTAAASATAPGRRPCSPESVRCRSTSRGIGTDRSTKIVKKRQRRLTGVDEIVLSRTSRGLTTGEVAANFDDVYGASVLKDTISRSRTR